MVLALTYQVEKYLVSKMLVVLAYLKMLLSDHQKEHSRDLPCRLSVHVAVPHRIL